MWAVYLLLVVIIIVIIVLACNFQSHKKHDCCEFKLINKKLNKLTCAQTTLLALPPQSTRYLGADDDPQIVEIGTYVPLLFPSITKEDQIVYNSKTGGFQVQKTGLYQASADVQELVVSPVEPDATVTAELFVSIGAAGDDTAKYGRISVPVTSEDPTTALSTATNVYLTAGSVVYFVTRVLNATSSETPPVNFAQNNATLVWVAP